MLVRPSPNGVRTIALWTLVWFIPLRTGVEFGLEASSERKGIRSDPFKIKKRTLETMTGQLKLGGRPANRILSHPVETLEMVTRMQKLHTI
ncbi:hypothetical protein OPV22_015406 [Ensete ventricosum]|uniref:Uncharacterized protein n=1 Tax=Ensete ventricosum TaxID=4639 RepID=A0AAV8R9V4_ENSVE|nr:hypothetical protein OPV22_015406 [Ensete ventricosum]